MKKIAFLFLYALVLFTNDIFSQHGIDSLNYYSRLVVNPNNTDDLAKSYIFFIKDKEINLSNKDISRAVNDLWYLASIEYKLGAYYYSENSAVEGLKLLDTQIKTDYNNQLRIGLLNKLGIIKRNLRAYNEAIEYYRKAIKLTKSKSGMATLHNNIGNAYYYLNNIKSARLELEKSYSISLETGDSSVIARSLDNLGLVQSKFNNPEALVNMLKALSIRINNNDYDIYSSYKNLTNYYGSKKEFKKTFFYAKKGYEEAKEFNSLPYKKDALEKLINLEQGNYSKEYVKVIKEIDSIKSNNENKYVAVKYNITSEQKKTKKEKSERIIYQFFGVLVLLSSFFIFFILKSRHKKAKLKERFDAERQFSKKLHDDVGNGLFHLMSKQQNKPNPDIELIDDLEKAYLKTRDISKTNAVLAISENFDQDLKDLVLNYKINTVNIFTRNVSQMPWDNLSLLKKETIYRVLQELMTNMRKHSKASIVTIKFENEQRKIAIQYVDNGVGCDLKKSNGLQNVENRIKDIGATITFESEINKGFQVKIIV
ncbi:tetratricopeptide repeat-containing sensor histidine kinase [Polaribacter huanghezhanensis]|uniref:tetratricopeptide repeat-containing sensor histidine kinase n=1 Tax=Polaribacter huanghezhanensis TaxID=1354726 RepID=UPI002649738A|nr:tetratricopeptide repeat-containing sensor histidine kinase [Polaribacter huanghezhanensis]